MITKSVKGKQRGKSKNVASLATRDIHIVYDIKQFLGHDTAINQIYGYQNWVQESTYCKISNIRRTQNQNLNVSRLIMQLPLPNPLKPGVKSRMKM